MADEKRDAEGESTVREVDFSALAGDEKAFSAYGFVRLKVRRGDEVLAIKVRIVSIPQEVLAGLRKQQPKPPVKPQKDPQTRQMVMLEDTGDPKYREKLEEYQLTLTREAVGRGIDETLTFSDGRPATTPEERYQALESRGLTGAHFNELASAIIQLTDWTEAEREQRL